MKMISMNRLSFALIAICLSVFVIACNKDNADAEPPVSEAEAEEYSRESMEAEASFDDIRDISMTAADEEGLASAAKPGTAGRPFPFLKLKLRIGIKAVITVTPDDNTYPKTVTIDFGDGDNCPDGKFRKGKIILHFTGPIREPGSVLTISLENFQVGRIKIEGTKVITNLSENGDIKFSVEVKDAKLTLPNGRGYIYEKLKYISQIAGGTTDDIMDDVYSIEGTAKTTFKNGVIIAMATKEALIKKTACLWISEGVLEVKVRNHEFELDYSYPNNGDCDDKALLKWNGREKIVVIP